MDNPYGYKMPYVPLASQVIDLKNVRSEPPRETAVVSAKAASAAAPDERPSINANDLTAVSVDAINSMLAMCSMVYMMCLQQLGGEAAEDIDQKVRPFLS